MLLSYIILFLYQYVNIAKDTKSLLFIFVLLVYFSITVSFLLIIS